MVFSDIDSNNSINNVNELYSRKNKAYYEKKDILIVDKESIYELQRIDCNCNDCIFLGRNNDEFKNSLERHHKWQLDYFNTLKNNLIKKARWWRYVKNDLERWDLLLTEAEKMKFQFDKKEAMINYGHCSKLLKNVQFIPNTCQLETQQCFKHRRD